jgi:hypothetical protein
MWIFSIAHGASWAALFWRVAWNCLARKLALLTADLEIEWDGAGRFSYLKAAW